MLIFEWESPNRDLPKELEDLKVKEYDLPFPKTVEEAVAQVYGLKSLVNPNVQMYKQRVLFGGTKNMSFLKN